MNQEEFQQLWRDDALDLVKSDADTSYRHGAYKDDVYQYEGRFWHVSYTVNGDGEEHGLRDGFFEGPTEVFPHTVVATEFRKEPQESVIVDEGDPWVAWAANVRAALKATPEKARIINSGEALFAVSPDYEDDATFARVGDPGVFAKLST